MVTLAVSKSAQIEHKNLVWGSVVDGRFQPEG